MIRVKGFHILGPEPPGDDDTPLRDHGLPVGPVEGGDGLPNAFVLLGRMFRVEFLESPPSLRTWRTAL